MARRRNRGAAGAGLLGIGLLALLAYCTGADQGSDFAPTRYAPPPLSVPAAAVDETPRDWLYIHDVLNVRAEPNRDARIVRALARGDRVQLGPKDANGWARLYSPGSEEGYVYRASDAVRTDPPPAPRTLISPPSGSSDGRSRSAARGYHTGPRGGCYTYTSSGRRRYVDRSNCR
jgi:hypothetical protein